MFGKTRFSNNTQKRVLRGGDFTIITFTLNSSTWTEILPEIDGIRHSHLIQFQGDGEQIIEINTTQSSTGAIWFASSQAINDLTGIFNNYSGAIYAKVKDAGSNVDGVCWSGR